MDRESVHHPDFYAALGRTITVLRTDAGVDRRELARRTGISYSYMSAIENGEKRASSPVLMTIADRLGLQLHELLGSAQARLERAGTTSPRSGTDPERSVAELSRLAAALTPGDRDLLLTMARRLAGREA